ncbi:MAG: hypothetical protein AAGB19_16985, partial [Cyanobacteria bacterium P01_F01_bin.3]
NPSGVTQCSLCDIRSLGDRVLPTIICSSDSPEAGERFSKFSQWLPRQSPVFDYKIKLKNGPLPIEVRSIDTLHTSVDGKCSVIQGRVITMSTDLATCRIGGFLASFSGDGQLFIHCGSIEEAKIARTELPSLSEHAKLRGANAVCIQVGDKVIIGPVHTTIWDNWRNMAEQNLIWTPADFSLAISNAEAKGDSLSILRMKDSKNLMTTSAKIKFAGIPWTEWLGRSFINCFPDNQYQYYVDHLFEYPGELTDIRYRARRVIPETMKPGEERTFFCKVRLVKGLDKEWYRMNYTLSSEPIRTV